MESTWKTKWIVFEVYGKDTRPGMLRNYFRSATCVQRFDDSLSCAIRITYRSSQRSSSIREPRDPPLKVVRLFVCFGFRIGFWFWFYVGFEVSQKKRDNKKVRGLFCLWGIHVNDPSAGSPTETLLRLLLPLNGKVWTTSLDKGCQRTGIQRVIRRSHRTIQSVGATGGVYKGQGRNQRELMTHTY